MEFVSIFLNLDLILHTAKTNKRENNFHHVYNRLSIIKAQNFLDYDI